MYVTDRSNCHNTKTAVYTIKNDTATVAFGGAVTGNDTEVGFTKLAVGHGEPKVSGPIAAGTADDNGCVRAVTSTGNHAKTVAGSYVGIGYDEKLAGVTATPLYQSAAGAKNAFMGTSGVYTIAYTDWSYMSGIASVDTNVGLTTFAADKAILATRSAPGRLTYLETGKTPTSDTYASRTL